MKRTYMHVDSTSINLYILKRMYMHAYLVYLTSIHVPKRMYVDV